MLFFIFLALGLWLIYIHRYLTRNHSYWSSLGIPGPKPLPFFGTYFWQFFIPFQESETERYEKYGKIYGIYDGTTPGLIVGKPELIKEIMIGSNSHRVFKNRRAVKTTHPIMSKFLSSLEDEEWDRVRQITTPSLTSGKLRSIIPIMEEASVGLLSTLEKAVASGNLIDLKELFGNYTMDVIAKAAFATIPDSHFVNQASQLFTFPFWRKFLDYVVPMNFLDPLGFTVLPPGPMDFFRKITIRIIRQRREAELGDESSQKKIAPDVLQLLMNASMDASISKRNSSRNLSEDEILAQAVLFFSVGFETSSQLLAYTGYCLSLNPYVQKLVTQEVQSALISNDGKFNYELLGKLPYLSATIDESLRLYNPVLRMERRASEDYELDGEGIVIKKGMIVGIPVWALHHSEEYFPDPYAFRPERFLDPQEAQDIKRSFTYLPFGEGPRKCIGTQFALWECKLALAKILNKYKFVQAPGNKGIQFFPTGRPLLGPKKILTKVEPI